MSFRTIRPGKRLLLVLPFLLLVSASGGCKERSWPLWNDYAARFVDPHGRVFDPDGDQHTTSEGEAYALFFSLVANDRGRFDRILSWTQANMAQGDLETHLPGWLWGKDPDGNWRSLDPNSAADADAWMAYTLVEAGRLWQFPAYGRVGLAMMRLMARNEVANLPDFGPMLMPGPFGFQHGSNWILNPSYLPVFIFERFAVIDPAGPWVQIAVRIPTLVEQSARHGWAMDWVDYVPGDGFYPATEQRPDGDKATLDAGGSYDAIRVYLWAGMMDRKDPARARILSAVPSMGAYLASHDAPPEKVTGQGIPQGQDGPVGFSAAVLPYVRSYPGLSRSNAQQLVRMAAQRNSSSGLYGKTPAYYDQNLALFATGFLDGRFRFGQGGELNVEWKLR
jgi:endo-1,4-beta-D-glucanase Y